MANRGDSTCRRIRYSSSHGIDAAQAYWRVPGTSLLPADAEEAPLKTRIRPLGYQLLRSFPPLVSCNDCGEKPPFMGRQNRCSPGTEGNLRFARGDKLFN
jgi:hypothetical protein